MVNKSVLTLLDFQVGDEVWWFKFKEQTYGFYCTAFKPGDIELVHDMVKEIKNDYLHCWHSSIKPEDVWGKTRKDAWERLKRDVEKWGSVE